MYQTIFNGIRYDVGGNEAHPKKNKKDVAVCPNCKTELYNGAFWDWCDKCEKVVEQTAANGHLQEEVNLHKPSSYGAEDM